MGLRYVVVEWNQASHHPNLLPITELWHTPEEARQEAEELRARTQAVGRRERYTIHTIDLDLDAAEALERLALIGREE